VTKFEDTMKTVGEVFGAPVMSYGVISDESGAGRETVVMPGYEEVLSGDFNFLDESDFIEEPGKREPRVKEVIEVKRVYVSADEIDHGHLGINIVIFGIAFLLALVLVALVYLLWNTFRRDKAVHERIVVNMDKFEKDLKGIDDSELQSERSVKA